MSGWVPDVQMSVSCLNDGLLVSGMNVLVQIAATSHTGLGTMLGP